MAVPFGPPTWPGPPSPWPSTPPVTGAAGGQAVRPSGWWYLAVGGLAVASVLAGVVLLVNGFRRAESTGREYTRVALGEEGIVTFDRPGDYTVAYEGPTQAVTEADVARLAEELDVSLEPVGGGPPVPLRPYEGLNDFREGPNQAVPVQTFSIERLGDYRLSCAVIDDVDPQRAGVSVGRSFYRELGRGAVAALVVTSIGLVVTVVAGIALAVTRGRAKRRLPPRGWAGPPSGPAGPPGWPGASPTWPGAPPGWGGSPIVPPPPPGYGPDQR